DRKSPDGAEWREPRRHFVPGLQGDSIEADVVVPHDIGGEERIIEPPEHDRDVLRGGPAPIIPQESAIQPDGVFAEIASRRAKTLIRAHWRTVLASADSQACGEATPEVRFEPEAHPKTKTIAFLIDIQLRREN